NTDLRQPGLLRQDACRHCGGSDGTLLIGAGIVDGHESAAFIEIEACRIAMTCVYGDVEAVQGRTAWAGRSATLRKRKAPSRRRAIYYGTGPKRRCSIISSWPSTIPNLGIVGRPRDERCRSTWKTSSKPI